MKSTLSKTFKSKIDAFNEALNGAAQNLKRAGEIIIEMLAENPDTFELLLRERPSLTLPFLESLERVGRDDLDPLLLTDPSPAAQRAISQALPMKEQKQLSSGFVPVAIRDNGGIRVTQKRLQEITSREACRVIAGGKIRTPEEQVKMIEIEIAHAASREMRYEIDGDKIRFRDNRGWFSWSDLESICEKIRPSATDIQTSIVANSIK